MRSLEPAVDDLAEVVVDVGDQPAAAFESVAGVLIRSARSLHHTVEGHKGVHGESHAGGDSADAENSSGAVNQTVQSCPNRGPHVRGDEDEPLLQGLAWHHEHVADQLLGKFTERRPEQSGRSPKEARPV